MSSLGPTATALLRDVLNLTRSDAAREARRQLRPKRTF